MGEQTALSEGRTAWKGEMLTALRTPLFIVEIGIVGEKGKEMFAYTQRLGAVKESALVLIDKAVASTQVTHQGQAERDAAHSKFLRVFHPGLSC